MHLYKEGKSLLQAAAILCKEIEQVPETKEYPCSDKISLNHSEAILQRNWQNDPT